MFPSSEDESAAAVEMKTGCFYAREHAVNLQLHACYLYEEILDCMCVWSGELWPADRQCAPMQATRQSGLRS